MQNALSLADYKKALLDFINDSQWQKDTSTEQLSLFRDTAGTLWKTGTHIGQQTGWKSMPLLADLLSALDSFQQSVSHLESKSFVQKLTGGKKIIPLSYVEAIRDPLARAISAFYQ